MNDSNDDQMEIETGRNSPDFYNSIMGLLQGRIEGRTFVVVDAFRLPVEGTETRVNAGAAANEFMIQYTELNELTTFSNSLVIGWYHSHPGYGCWLSGIDVATQALYQEHQDPFLAIVIDPFKTKQLKKVEIGAFRTWPDGYTSASSGATKIPTDRMEEFGIHCNKYYSLKIEYPVTSDEKRAMARVIQDNWVGMLASSVSDRDAPNRIEVLQKSLSEANEATKHNKPDSTEACKKLHECTCASFHEAAQRVIQQSIITKLLGRK